MPIILFTNTQTHVIQNGSGSTHWDVRLCLFSTRKDLKLHTKYCSGVSGRRRIGKQKSWKETYRQFNLTSLYKVRVLKLRDIT